MKRTFTFLSRLLKERAGSSLLELAVGSGLLVAAGSATFQYGYIFYQYNSLKNAVNTGARWASMAAYDSPSAAPSAAFQNRVKNMVVYGTPTAGTSPVIPNLTTDNVQLQVTFENSVPAEVEVSVNDFTISGVFGSMQCSNKPVVRFAYQGIWAPAP